MNVAVLVPRRSDGGGIRDQTWTWLAARWAAERPGYRIVEGHDDDDGPFNRSRALNRAARQAADADVLVVADGDSFTEGSQLADAVDRAVATGQITFAYDRFCYLSRAGSVKIMGGFRGMWEPFVEFTMTGTCSSAVVTTRALWDQVGGFDETFVGWGGEDVAFSLACQTFGGGLQRIPGPVWHLWHPPAPHTHDHIWPERIKLYAAAAYRPDAMRELVEAVR